MFESSRSVELTRNIIVYLAGIAFAVIGALGLVDMTTLDVYVSVALLVLGLMLVVLVHEYLDGPF